MNLQFDKTTLGQITRELSQGNASNVRVGYLTGKLQGDKVAVDGVYVPKQDSSISISTIPPEEHQNALQILKDKEKNIVGLITYHGDFEVFESATTRRSRQKLSEETKGPNLGIVVNSQGKYQIYQ